MSAWIVNDEHISAMLAFMQEYMMDDDPNNYLGSTLRRMCANLRLKFKYSPLNKKELPLFLHELGWKMAYNNHRAVSYRYDEKNPTKWSWTKCRMPKVHQFIKYIDCWQYQCSEGRWDNTRIYKFMDDVKMAVCYHTVYSHDLYEQAEWGYTRKDKTTKRVI